MGWLSQQRYETEFAAETERFVAAVARPDLTATVPTCPEWTFHDLISHVGTGHRLASAVIARAPAGPPAYAVIEAPERWPQWLTDGAAELIAAVRERGFDEPVWTWQPAHPGAGFWLRRMLHDEIIHRVDADPAARVAPDLAADGISDILDVVATLAGTPAMGGLTRMAGTLQLRTPEDAWHVTTGPSGVTWRHGDAPADETVTATSAELLLVLNRRRPPVDPGPLFAHWLETTTF
jgi:uncharacterized protein (TIGR03083 family)